MRCFLWKMLAFKCIFRLSLSTCLLISGCSCSNNETVSVPNFYSQPDREEDERAVPVNPYDDGSGHSAGYEWAEKNEVADCGGNSESFIEGCEEYVRQRDDAENSENEFEGEY